mmetsp:Transcript_18369/g.32518  ORF Transcript_18369/g.32518 Transcript_18369/m.32518 type:complete len:565 (+) Transcript_18369:195-1889(+)
MNVSYVTKLATSYPRTPGFTYVYGTAGFRENHKVLDAVCVRMGMLAALRTKSAGSGVGLMVTASHNPVEDNGLKAVDPDGGMLARNWESVAVDLVNAEEDQVLQVIEEIAKTMKVHLDGSQSALLGSKVVIGRDTRPHSERLASLAIKGVEALGGTVLDIGVVTTPQLHHVVRSGNLKEEEHLASVEGYYTKLSEAFHDLLDGVSITPSPIIVDAAYGVGGPRFKELLTQVNREGVMIDAEVRNSPTSDPNLADEEAEKLNNKLGAEHVQKGLAFPRKTLKLPDERMIRCCSFDGDADRIVYYRATDEDKLNLFDGDKIACLLTFFIQKQLKALPKSLVENVSLGCVQTAYANGASSKYIKSVLNVNAPVTKTGVKHCHHKALEYDIGVYFEANGHGTVLFQPSFISKVRKELESGRLNHEKHVAAATNILALEQLINQATGDAMADLLAVEAVLLAENLSLDDWNEMYTDLPSRQLKCRVSDRAAITTTDDEARVIEPAELQDAIDYAVSQYQHGRAFARPSGTEDAVRVYAEAADSEMADALALKVAQAIWDHAGGVGERPH